MKIATISALILTKNEAQMIAACLRTVQWCDEIIVLDSNSTDDTVAVSKKWGASVYQSSEMDFSKRREKLARYAQSQWLLYLDADERISPALADEIQAQLSQNASLQIRRSNIFFAHQMLAGGWQNEWVTRVMRKANLQGWQGSIHESPRLTGAIKQLQQPLIHFSHRSVQAGLVKTTTWTPLEAEALARVMTTPVTAQMVIRKGMGELYRRIWKEKGFKDGTPGYMEAIIQSINRMLVYLQVWELQQKPTISEQYVQMEKEIESLWATHQLPKQ